MTAKHKHRKPVVKKWTQYEIDFLTRNYKLMSYVDIGSKLGRSKNSVIGQAGRLNLQKGHSKKKPEPKPVVVDFVLPKDNPLASHKAGQCLYIKDNKCCSAQALKPYPYCVEHKNICYVKRKKKNARRVIYRNWT